MQSLGRIDRLLVDLGGSVGDPSSGMDSRGIDRGSRGSWIGFR